MLVYGKILFLFIVPRNASRGDMEMLGVRRAVHVFRTFFVMLLQNKFVFGMWPYYEELQIKFDFGYG